MPGSKFHTDKTGFANYCSDNKHRSKILATLWDTGEIGRISWRKSSFDGLSFQWQSTKTDFQKNNFETFSIQFYYYENVIYT
ncbi:hypothetical protein LEP1GSC016_1177 [Leptospira borgpetersenii serovar Hardjo-bovis str. Sponselee]|uniref:Uncharacterized protein n=1 Tax=Leptospira borgpetersenii serovar Hardjo-bovis str. Sponselee TaxID=1303729 RepID=M6BU66_LEPBO|nr:hypothetical protein LEP1GSC016_1177 [Leptospira borgpetersenii serovar Hardjo-bovis str. Sponselee]